MELSILPVSRDMRELNRHGSKDFPIQYYVDELFRFQDQTIPLHWHPELEIFVVRGGDAQIQIDQKTSIYKEGTGIFINANVLHSFHQTEKTQMLQCPNIVFMDEMIAPTTSRAYENYVSPIVTNHQLPYIIFDPQCHWANEILLHLDYIFSLLQKYGPYDSCHPFPILNFKHHNTDISCYEMAVQCELSQLWQLLYSHLHDIPLVPTPKNERLLQIRTQKMLNFIHNRYASQITLADIAASADISKSEAARCFQAYLHTSPVNYLIAYRMEKAKWQLRNNMETIAQISQKCGFSSFSYFCKMFRRQTGMTAKQYRDNHFSKIRQ